MRLTKGTFADTCALGAFAGQLVLVGDPGQIAPVVTGATRRWDGAPTAPHLPAPVALMAAYGEAVSVVRLRHSWRLGPATTAVVAPTFYPTMPFSSLRPSEHLNDEGGEPLPEVATCPVAGASGPGDPAFIRACADRVRGLLAGSLSTVEGTRQLTGADIMVVTGHVAQAAAVRALLADHPTVLVGTGNAVQGMERAAAVVLHPLAGYRSLDGFGTDPGRACVMLSRHRAHLSLITDPATERLLDVPDPDAATVTHRRLWGALGRQ